MANGIHLTPVRPATKTCTLRPPHARPPVKQGDTPNSATSSPRSRREITPFIAYRLIALSEKDRKKKALLA